MFNCGTLYLLLSVAVGRLSDEDWGRNQPMSIAEYHEEESIFIERKKWGNIIAFLTEVNKYKLYSLKIITV